ncbi:MAG: Fe-S cluster assembly sulfur transfer protein SufU [Candidatus Kapaibacterium sp.]|jgi:nitrogen fixation NifU-like protein|nr:SUF system NifU family Fe-S cluster assembly protein [Candidatus Kapabacteria bacterium]
MNEIQQLYQQVILDHNKSPRNYGHLPECSHKADGLNPLCGDHITVELYVHDGIIQDIRFTGAGCAISTSSASIMTTVLKGKTAEEAERIFQEFHGVVTNDDAVIDEESLGKLAVFAGVREFPARVKCASLAWHTVHAALQGEQEISTE